MNRKLLKPALAALLAALVACSGGDNGGIDGTGATSDNVSYGTITGFGSVWVNGVRFNVDRATIRLDGGVVSQQQLAIGMVVRVDGSIADARATAITVDDAVKGKVERVVDANRFVVMGQEVVVDSRTRYGTGFAPAVGDIVEVHGLPTADGVITAGYVQKKSALASPPFAVKGFVKAHDTAARRFQIGTLVVDYTGASFSDLPAGSWNGRVVEVKGSTCAGDPVCGTLTASRVGPTGAALASAPRAEFEGFVTVVGTNGFTLGATPVVVNTATVYRGGLLSDIVVGTKLEVQGRVENGTLTATRVEFSDDLRLLGSVSSVDLAAGTVIVAGLPNVPVKVNALTRLENLARLADLAVGQGVEIEARAGADEVLATELKVQSGNNGRVELQGPVAVIDGSTSITIQNTLIATAGITEYRLRDGATVDRARFLAAIGVGTLLKARGTLTGNVVAWTRLELEDD